MEALYKISDNVTMKIEGSNLQEIIQNITNVRKAIGPEPCGKCKSNNTFPEHRHVKPYDYYEIKCGDCGASLSLGTHADNDKTLFKKVMQYDDKNNVVKDENDKGKLHPTGGWTKWNFETKRKE